MSNVNALIREAIGEAMKGLEAMDLRVIDKEITKPLPRGRESATLPISTDRLPLQARTIQCLLISGWFWVLGDAQRAEAWMRAAIWRKYLKLAYAVVCLTARFCL